MVSFQRSFSLHFLGIFALYGSGLVLSQPGPTSGLQTSFISINSSPRRADYHIVEIGSVPGREQIKRRLRIENLTQENLEIVSVHKTCSCVQFTLPDSQVAKPGQLLEVEFSIDIDKYVKKLDHEHSVVLETRGARDKLTLGFEYTLENYIGFTTQHNYVTYAEKSGKKKSIIPLIVSPDIRLKDYELRLDKECQGWMETKFVEVKGAPAVECTFDAENIPKDISGVVEILRRSKSGGERVAVSDCYLHFASVKWFSILPSTLVFTPKKVAVETLREATGIVRIRTSSAELGDLQELKCETSQGVKLPCEFTKVRDGYFRFAVSTIEKDDLVSNESLKFTAATTNGRTEVFVTGVLSN